MSEIIKMSEFAGLDAIENINSEVDYMKTKISVIEGHIKFQKITINNLRQECQTRKELCQHLRSSNSRLKGEIKSEEQNIESKRAALADIKSSNIDLQMELSSGQEDFATKKERMRNGVRKYQTMWLEAKERYESTPTFQQWVEVCGRTQRAQVACGEMTTKTENLRSAIAKEKAELARLRIARFTALSDYMKNERPRTLKQIEEKEKLKRELISKANDAKMKKNVDNNASLPAEKEEHRPKESNARSVDTRVDEWPHLFSNLDNIIGSKFEMPELQLPRKEHNFHMSSIYAPKPATNKSDCDLSKTDIKSDPLYASYMDGFSFNRISAYDIPKPTKLSAVNVLENRPVDEGTVNDIMSRVDTKTLKPVDNLNINYFKAGSSRPSIVNFTINYENEDIDVIEILSPQELFVPPTQFSDKTLNGSQKKKVCFDIQEPDSQVTLEAPVEAEETSGGTGEAPPSGAECSTQLDLSNSSLDDSTNFRDLYLAKHNLHSSPNFVYGKNTTLQNMTEKVVASKFFSKTNVDSPEKKLSPVEPSKSSPQAATAENDSKGSKEKDNSEINNNHATTKDEEEAADVHKQNPRSPHTRDPQSTLESPNITINTTADDNDLGHCLDASLLLSPKGDMQPPESMLENVSDTSFLSGLRKNRLSFFGNTCTDNRTDTSAQDSGNDFSFDFGSAKKKKTGGLFNIF